MWAEGTGGGEEEESPWASELEGAGACLLSWLSAPRLPRRTGPQGQQHTARQLWGHRLSEHLAEGDASLVRPQATCRDQCRSSQRCGSGAGSFPTLSWPLALERPRELMTRAAPAVTSSGPQTPVDPPPG